MVEVQSAGGRVVGGAEGAQSGPEIRWKNRLLTFEGRVNLDDAPGPAKELRARGLRQAVAKIMQLRKQKPELKDDIFVFTQVRSTETQKVFWVADRYSEDKAFDAVQLSELNESQSSVNELPEGAVILDAATSLRKAKLGRVVEKYTLADVAEDAKAMLNDPSGYVGTKTTDKWVRGLAQNGESTAPRNALTAEAFVFGVNLRRTKS